MTLRVEVSIVPHGNEDEKRVIETINISNLGPVMSNTTLFDYGVEIGKYKTGDYDFFVHHNRNNGAIGLVKLVMERINADR